MRASTVGWTRSGHSGNRRARRLTSARTWRALYFWSKQPVVNSYTRCPQVKRGALGVPKRGPMFAIDPILLTTIVALPVSLISFAAVRAARSARRNHEDRCGNCGGPLYAPGSLAGPSLLQGHLICEPCAAKERRTLRGSLIAAATITGVGVLTLAAVAIWAPAQLGSHPWVPVVATVLTYPAIFGSAIAWMKRANRRAAHRLGLHRDLSLEASNDSTLALTAGGSATYRGGRADA